MRLGITFSNYFCVILGILNIYSGQLLIGILCLGVGLVRLIEEIFYEKN